MTLLRTALARVDAATLLPIALAVLSTSCVAVEGFDPVGDVAAIAGAWRIDSAPASEPRCETLGAERVRITFLDGLRPVTHSGLFARCEDGSIDTRAGSVRVVGAGRWTVRLDALAADGTLIAAGPSATMQVDPPGTDPGSQDGGTDEVPLIRVPDANFFTATLSAAYRIAGRDASADTCDAAGIASVGFAFDDLGGGEVSTTEPEPCAVGVVGTRIAPGFTYVVRLRATNLDGGTVFETEPRTVSVSAGQDIRLDAAGAVEIAP